MNKDTMLRLIEDLADSSLPLNEYCVRVYRDNGTFQVHVHHTLACGNFQEISDMYGLSEIFNSHSTDWIVEYKDKNLKITVR